MSVFAYFFPPVHLTNDQRMVYPLWTDPTHSSTCQFFRFCLFVCFSTCPVCFVYVFVFFPLHSLRAFLDSAASVGIKYRQIKKKKQMRSFLPRYVLTVARETKLFPCDRENIVGSYLKSTHQILRISQASSAPLVTRRI